MHVQSMKILRKRRKEHEGEATEKSGKGHEGEATDDDKCFKH